MKTTTAIKKIEALGLNKGTKAYRLVMDALTMGNKTIRPCHTSGRGRFTSNLDYTSQVLDILRRANIKHSVGNDSPRGGLTGNYIILTHIEF